MVDRSNADNLKKQDLELILEVNKKAIQIQTEVAERHEEIVEVLDEIKNIQGNQDRKLEEQDEKLDKLVVNSEATDKSLFRIQVLFVTGLLALVAQIIQIFTKK
jgi:hypothetical protein